jgi:uncharacterized protein
VSGPVPAVPLIHDDTCHEPVRRSVMVQRWTDVVFLHWRVEPELVQRLLPDGVSVDTFDGSAWVGLVPFSMEGLGFARLHPLPVVGAFPEVNVRTYVRVGDRRGVWFFSLDIDRIAPALVARTAYRIPYCTGEVSHLRTGDVITTRVQRRWPRAASGAAVTSHITVRTGAPIADGGDVARFLTARWGLYSAGRRGGLRYAPVEHAPWPLHEAEVLHLDDRLVAAAGLPDPAGLPHVLYSPGVDVRVGRPRSA